MELKTHTQHFFTSHPVLKIQIWKLQKHDCEICHFLPRSLYKWRHKCGWNVWQKYQMSPDNLFCFSLVKGKPTTEQGCALKSFQSKNVLSVYLYIYFFWVSTERTTKWNIQKKIYAVAYVLSSGQLVPSVHFPFKAFAMDINSLTLIVTQTLLFNSCKSKTFWIPNAKRSQWNTVFSSLTTHLTSGVCV